MSIVCNATQTLHCTNCLYLQGEEVGISDVVNAYHTYKQQWTTTDKKKMVTDASKALQEYYAKLNTNQLDLKSPDFDTDEYGWPRQASRPLLLPPHTGHASISTGKNTYFLGVEFLLDLLLVSVTR